MRKVIQPLTDPQSSLQAGTSWMVRTEGINSTGRYVFRRHWPTQSYRSVADWIMFRVGKLTRVSRLALVRICSDQDPLTVGNDRESNCVACVKDAIRYLY
ncbi:hypothetical protein BC628DRAFT_1002583, partial [Trametes gibbosa]